MTPRTLATGLAATALFAVGGLAAALPAAAAPTAPFTALSVRFPTAGAGGTGALTYDLTDGGAVLVAPTPEGGVTTTGIRTGSVTTLRVTPRVGESLAAGQSIQLAATPTATLGSVTLTTGFGDCTYTSGSVVVHELVGDSSSTTTFAADVTGTCGTVQARVAAATSWTGLAVPGSVDLGSADLVNFAERDVVVKVTGTSAVTFGTATVAAPTDPDAFPEFGIVADGCKGTVVVPDGTCTVTVGFQPWFVGERTGTLSVPDTTGTGSTLVRLVGSGTTDSKGTYSGFPAPKRLLDTRTDGAKTPLAGGSTTRLQVAGVAGIPASGVSAVVLNLTAVNTATAGYFTVYPNGVARPTASSINFPKGWTGANMVTVPVGADGKVALYDNGGAAHAVVDVLGWYWSDTEQPLGSQLFPIGDAERVYDSRLGDGPLRGGDVVDLSDLVLGTPTDTADIAQIIVNITAVGATRPGVLTAWSGEGTRPKASTVNYEPKVIAPNMAVVTAGHGAGGAGLRIANTTSGSVHVVVDLVGIQFANSPYGLRFTPRATPTRILDTRVPTGLAGPFGPAQTRTVNASKVTGLDTWAIVANTTGIKPTKQTYLTTWSGEPGSQRPDASLLNVNPGVVRSASTYAFTDLNRFKLYNNAGSMHVALDVAGTLDFYPSSDVTGPLAAVTPATSSDAGGLTTVRGFTGRAARTTVTVKGVNATLTRR
jgi:hypothetical protein